MPGFPAPALTAWFHINNACNLSCDYCYLDHAASRMSEEVGRQAVDAVFRSARLHQTRRIKLKYGGGEPTLSFPRVLSLHRYAQHLLKNPAQSGPVQSIDGIILTNGVDIQDDWILAAQDLKLRFAISLDGIGAMHDAHRKTRSGAGTFDKVLETLERMKRLDARVSITVTVSKRNLGGLPELVAFLNERELPFSLNYYRENPCSEVHQDLSIDNADLVEVMKPLLQQVRSRPSHFPSMVGLIDRANVQHPHRHACGVGRSYLVITPTGGVAKCHMDLHNIVTNLSAEDPLGAIQADCQGIQNPSVDDKPGCRSCQHRYLCAGGCPLLTHRRFGDYHSRSPYCPAYQELIPVLLSEAEH